MLSFWAWIVEQEWTNEVIEIIRHVRQFEWWVMGIYLLNKVNPVVINQHVYVKHFHGSESSTFTPQFFLSFPNNSLCTISVNKNIVSK